MNKNYSLTTLKLILLSIGLGLTGSSVLAEANEEQDIIEPHRQYVVKGEKQSLQLQVDLGETFKNLLSKGVTSGLGSIAGSGFTYLMRMAGSDSVDNKLRKIIEALDHVQEDLDTIKINQQELKTLISDSFYNLHLETYVSALERSLYKLTYNNPKSLLYASNEDMAAGLQQLERLYNVFFTTSEEKRDYSNNEIIGYVEKNLLGKTHHIQITQADIDSINYIKDNAFYILKADYFPTQIAKEQLLGSFNADLSVDIAASINYINNGVSSVALAYGSMMQKAYMVMQVLAVLKEKDNTYANFYLGDVYENKNLQQGLNAGEQDVESRILNFVQYIEKLYITNKVELIRNLTNIYVTAGAEGKVGTIEDAINHCEIIHFIPLTKNIMIDCSAKEPEKNSDYAYRFAANLGPLHDNSRTSPNIVEFYYGEGISPHFKFNYINPITNREVAHQYFSRSTTKKPFSIDPYSVNGVYRNAPWNAPPYDIEQQYYNNKWFKFNLDNATSSYAIEGERVNMHDCKDDGFTTVACSYSASTMVLFSLTGNFVLVHMQLDEHSWFLGGTTGDILYYIAPINGDNTTLPQTLIVPKYTTLPDRHYAVQQAFSTGAALIMERSDGFTTYWGANFDRYDTTRHIDQTTIYTYNPLQIKMKSNADDEVGVSIGGDWLQYCDRSRVTLIKTTEEGKQGWSLESMCHADINKADDFIQTQVFISEDVIQKANQSFTKTIQLHYEPNESALKLKNIIP